MFGAVLSVMQTERSRSESTGHETASSALSSSAAGTSALSALSSSTGVEAYLVGQAPKRRRRRRR